MAGLVPAIHVLPSGTKNVDARDKPGHDNFVHYVDVRISTLALATIKRSASN